VKHSYLLIAFFQVLLGIVIANNPTWSFYLSIAVLVIALVHVVISGNRNNQAAMWAGYVVGLEILFRMTSGYLIWETGKYFVILIFLTGLAIEAQKKPLPYPIVYYGLLLVPSFAVVSYPDFFEFRSSVSFNLSGPLTLLVSSVYFYKRPMPLETMFNILRFVALPLISILVYLILVTPELSEIEYGTQSNFQASAGFGPNQVSTVMGLGIFITGLLLYHNRRVTGWLWTDLLLLLLLTIRGLATFSRGGMVGGVVALILIIVLAIALLHQRIYWPRAIMYSVGFFAVMTWVWNYVNEVSEHRLQYRYQGVDYRTGKPRDITSSRIVILEHELDLFKNNPVFGIGPGMVRQVALRDKYVANSHSEYTRTLAEHGLFGLIAVVIMVMFPVRYVVNYQPKTIRHILLALIFLVFFTLFHSAMRLAMPGFLYGLCFILPVFNQKT
jgi:O-antigen ligase